MICIAATAVTNFTEYLAGYPLWILCPSQTMFSAPAAAQRTSVMRSFATNAVCR
jgi:hypothetical protein